jgi:hypothetical protein
MKIFIALIVGVMFISWSCGGGGTKTTINVAPSAPTELVVIATSGTEISLYWQDKSENESGFKVERKGAYDTAFTEISMVEANKAYYKDVNLTCETIYTYKILSYNEFGNSDYTSEVQATTQNCPLDIPGSPTELQATAASATQINLNWKDNSSKENLFRIERKLGANGTWAQVAVTENDSNAYSDMNLSCASTYFYRVRANNTAGDSNYSNEASAATQNCPLTAPIAPSNLSATAASSSQINLSWQDKSDDEEGFKIEQRVGTSGFYSQIGTVSAGVLTFQITGLTCATIYYYRVRANNSAGDSDYSNEANAPTSACPAEVPTAPSGITATAISETQAFIYWQDESDNEEGFKVERKLGSGGTYAEVGTSGTGITSYRDSGLACASTYYYRVRAYNGTGNSSYSGEVSVPTHVCSGVIPVSPSTLAAGAVSSSQIDLTWQDNSNNENIFKIERKTGSGGTWAQVAVVVNNTQSYSDRGLGCQTAYYYRIRANNSVGDSSYSNEANATTQTCPPSAPAAPTVLNAVTASSCEINVSWTDNSSNEDGFKIERKQGVGGTYAQIAIVGMGVNNYSDSACACGVSYYYRVRAYNGYGNSGYSGEGNASTSCPNTTITSFPPNPSNIYNATYQFSCSGASSPAFECKIDSGSWSSCHSGDTFYWIPPGNRTFQVRCVDAAGNYDSTPGSNNWNITAKAWTSSAIDAPKTFTNFYPRAITVDANGYPHIAYGGDNLYHAYFNGSVWNYEIADNSPGVGEYAAISLDSSNHAHICYRGSGSQWLLYATNASGAWASEVIDNNWNTGMYCSIGVDSNGKAHISYYGQDYLKYATNSSGVWNIITIDSDWNTGYYSSLAVDSNDKVHVSYIRNDMMNSAIRYATNMTGSWTIETIESGMDQNYSYTAIALDPAQKAHISYTHSQMMISNREVKYANNVAGSWTIDNIEFGTERTFSFTSIGLDASSKAHIAYTYENWMMSTKALRYANNITGGWLREELKSNTNSNYQYVSLCPDRSDKFHLLYYLSGNLMYLTDKTGVWVESKIDEAGDAGMYTSIGLDSNNKVRISYYAQDKIKYIKEEGWAGGTIATGKNIGKYTSLEIDLSGFIHVSYWDQDKGWLMYANNITGGWTRATADSNWAGQYSSIDIDSSGKAYISYVSNGQLMYATNKLGMWMQGVVDSDMGGSFTSIELDASEFAHISYCSNGKLKYASNVLGGWEKEIVDSGCEYSAIDLDQDSKAHICYASNSSIRYATNAYGLWMSTWIDSTGMVMDNQPCSIYVDSQNTVHISYYDSSNNELKYATNAWGDWQKETVDSNGTVGSYNSIILDSQGNVHISYYDFGNKDLKYATNKP